MRRPKGKSRTGPEGENPHQELECKGTKPSTRLGRVEQLTNWRPGHPWNVPSFSMLGCALNQTG